jgi:hypothetical protein
MDIAAASATYGADEDGLICGFACTPDGTADIGCGRAAEWLPAPGPAGFLWLHFNLES